MTAISMGSVYMFLFIIVIAKNCVGFPDGPHITTCLTMFPKHGQDLTWKKSGPCPFQMKLSSVSYQPLQNITITVEADDGTELKGVQISAHRKLVNVEEFLGQFVHFSPEDKLQAFSCFGGLHNQVAHKNNNTVNKLTIVWQAPDENVGDILFKATFVRNLTTFWAWETQELKAMDHGSVIMPSHVFEVPTRDMEEIDFSGCGSDKGCFFYPRYCSGSNCDAAVTYRKVGELYTFEMMAKSPGYVTIGLSKDKFMGDDNTIVCIATKDLISVQNGINPDYFNHRVQTQNLTNLRVKQTQTHVMCTFTRPRVLGVKRWVFRTDPPETTNVFFDLEDDWHIMMSWGHVPVGTDVMGRHTELPVVSDSHVDFQSVDVHSGSAMSREVQGHGSLMVIAWVLLAGLAVVVARYFKDLRQSKVVCQTKVWFQIHRCTAICTLLLVIASFVVIFVKLQRLIDSVAAGRTHAIVGITVGVAVLLQVFVGMIRPGPDSKVRPWFRWSHRLLGMATHLLAAANMYLAFNMRNTPKSMSWYGSIAIPVWLGVQLAWALILEFRSCRKKSQGNVVISNTSTNDEETQSFTRSDSILLILYCLTLVTFTVTLLCGVLLF